MSISVGALQPHLQHQRTWLFSPSSLLRRCSFEWRLHGHGPSSAITSLLSGGSAWHCMLRWPLYNTAAGKLSPTWFQPCRPLLRLPGSCSVFEVDIKESRILHPGAPGVVPATGPACCSSVPVAPLHALAVVSRCSCTDSLHVSMKHTRDRSCSV